jgi:hypothetical protein
MCPIQNTSLPASDEMKQMQKKLGREKKMKKGKKICIQ